MKRVVPLILAVINVLGLVGCTGTFFTTAEYRTYQTFAEKHNAGMEKQTILNELGRPDGYCATATIAKGINKLIIIAVL